MITRRHLIASGVAAAFGIPHLARAQRQAATREIVDDAGRRLQLPANVNRIFAAGPPASLLLHALAPQKLLGWTTPFRDAEKPFMPASSLALPALGRLTGRGNSANLETVLAAKPDLIIDYGSVNATYVSLADRIEGQTGIPYLLLDGSLNRLDESVIALGLATGDESRAVELAAWLRDKIGDLDARLARRQGKAPRVYYGRGPRGLDTGLGGSINTELIERLGAENVAAALGRGGLVQVSIEQVLAWAPDVIITIDPNFFALLRQDPIWRGMPAVRNGRVHLAPAVPFGWIDFPPGPNRILGLDWLARRLYPDMFDDDPRDFVSEAYRQLYHRAPDKAQLDQLLA